MKHTKNTYFMLLIIVAIAAILRLWSLGNVPVSPDWDEVAHGYNAFSILHTGRDEYGKLFPVILRSYDDYKPALYTYLTVPSIAVFGMNVFAVRLPSALFGIVAVIGTFFLVRELFRNDTLALISSGMLAISPWHLQFSRVAFESNIGDALNILAALFFIKGLKKPWFLSIAFMCAGLSIYAYQSEKVFVPIFVILLIFVYFKSLIGIDKKKLITACIVGCIVVLPMVFSIINDKAVLSRIKGASIFQAQDTLLKHQVITMQYEVQQNDILGKVLDNRRVVYIKSVVSGYVAHFNPNWLLSGDNNRHHAPDMGLIYFWELPFILIGIYSLLFHKFDTKTKMFIFGWFLLAPLPASVTTEVPHAVRTLNFLPVWQIFTGIGLIMSYRYFHAVVALQLIRRVIISGVIIVCVASFVYYLNQYFVQQNYYYARDWQYGYEQTIANVQAIQGNYNKIIVADTTPMDNSYMFFLFYLKFPPSEYQAEQKAVFENNNLKHAFGKYEFRPILWNKENKDENTLFVGRPNDFQNSKPSQIIKDPDGNPVIYLVGTE